MSSLSQEESRSISENTTWGQRRRFADGKASVAFSHFLGYDRGPHGEWVVNEEQAETVKEIYRLFLEGYSYAAIAKKLSEEGKPSPFGKKKLPVGTVKSVLQNLMLAIWIQSSDSIYVENIGKSSISAAFGSGGVQDRGI